MVRVTQSVPRNRRKKRLFKAVKGFWGDRKNHVRNAKDALMKAMAYSTEHRRKKKGDFRRLWITRIGVAAKMEGISYSRMIDGLTKADCKINRKILADLAVHDPQAFAEIAGIAKQELKQRASA